ncbi:DUF2335 domain-containing protein [Synechococcus sp. CS-1324]|uniref:DUF2335 domain-containing protein n=1 Tax=Synechococcus sp. CS-1324 TaxID=2847980 RepID=UPI00223A7ACA|nr:DUF2335 domain-containing protein [Synechococcus sp. CS-1324]MCT0229362.1 DUF2335 domain-containing protein [Synechococcus sp. CS-1324]
MEIGPDKPKAGIPINQPQSLDQDDEADLSVDPTLDTEVLGNDNAGQLGYREVSVSSWEGPLPHPDILAKYNQVISNGADRVMAMAEKEQTHRHDLEEKITNSVSSENSRGQWFAFIIACASLCLAAYLFAVGKNSIAVCMVLGDFLIIAGAFIGVRILKSRDGVKEEDPRA